MSRFARLGRALVLVLAAGFAVLVVLSYRKPGARTEEASDPVAETLVAEANGARDRMRFRDFQYDETRESEGRYRVTADRGGALRREGRARVPAEGRRLRVAGVEGGPDGLDPRAARRAHGGVARVPASSTASRSPGRTRASRAPPSATTRRAASSPPTGRSTRRAEASSRTRTPAPSTRATASSLLDGDARLRGRGDEGRPVELRAPRVLVGRDGRLEASGGAISEDGSVRPPCGDLPARDSAGRQPCEGDDGRASPRPAGSRAAAGRPDGRGRRPRSLARSAGPARRLRGERAGRRRGSTSPPRRRRGRDGPRRPASRAAFGTDGCPS